jgi:hypothetical protein
MNALTVRAIDALVQELTADLSSLVDRAARQTLTDLAVRLRDPEAAPLRLPPEARQAAPRPAPRAPAAEVAAVVAAPVRAAAPPRPAPPPPAPRRVERVERPRKANVFAVPSVDDALASRVDLPRATLDQSGVMPRVPREAEPDAAPPRPALGAAEREELVFQAVRSLVRPTAGEVSEACGLPYSVVYAELRSLMALRKIARIEAARGIEYSLVSTGDIRPFKRVRTS